MKQPATPKKHLYNPLRTASIAPSTRFHVS